MFLRSRTYSSCKFTGNKLRSGREPIKLLFDRSNTINFDALLKLYIRDVWFVNRFELKFLRTTKFLMWLAKIIMIILNKTSMSNQMGQRKFKKKYSK